MKSGVGPTARGAERVSAILDAAERLLVDRGAEGLTLRGVATESGIRLGHLQHFFATRPLLVEALLARILERSEHAIRVSLGALDPAAEASLDRALEGMLAAQRDPQLVRVFYELWALGARDRSVSAALQRFYGAWSDRIAELLAARAPGSTARERAARARLFVCCLEGVSLLRSGVIGESDRAFEALARAILRGVLTGGAQKLSAR